MYQSSQSYYRDGSMPEPKFGHQIEMISIAILYIGFFSCLIRSDYNFPVIFFVYFIWQQRKDSLALKLMLACVITVSLFDLMFIFTEIRVWVSDDPHNPIWGTLSSMHYFGIFCFGVILLLKIILMVFIGRAISNMNSAVQPV